MNMSLTKALIYSPALTRTDPLHYIVYSARILVELSADRPFKEVCATRILILEYKIYIFRLEICTDNTTIRPSPFRGVT